DGRLAGIIETVILNIMRLSHCSKSSNQRCTRSEAYRAVSALQKIFRLTGNSQLSDSLTLSGIILVSNCNHLYPRGVSDQLPHADLYRAVWAYKFFPAMRCGGRATGSRAAPRVGPNSLAG